MFSQLTLARFTLSGRSHLKLGSECQDSVVQDANEHLALCLSSDGISAQSQSKIGSLAQTQALRRLLMENSAQIAQVASGSNSKEFAEGLIAWLNKELGEQLTWLGRFLKAGDEIRAVGENLLATLLGVVVTESHAVIFGCGDGFFAINDAVVEIVATEENHPEVPGYQIGSQEQRGALKVFFHGETSKVSRLMVGTDGVRHIALATTHHSEEEVDEVGEFEDLEGRAMAVSRTASSPNDDASYVGMFRSDNKTDLGCS